MKLEFRTSFLKDGLPLVIDNSDRLTLPARRLRGDRIHTYYAVHDVPQHDAAWSRIQG